MRDMLLLICTIESSIDSARGKRDIHSYYDYESTKVGMNKNETLANQVK